MTLHFIKMQGLGNDYVYIDCFQAHEAEAVACADVAALARRVSDRHCGIGSDGLVLMLPSETADAKMRIFNADGSEAQMPQGTTATEHVNAAGSNATAYDLQGRPVSSGYKGIIIHNGHKYISL